MQPLSQDEFNLLTQFLHQKLGMVCGETNRMSLGGRLERRVSELGYDNFKSYFLEQLVHNRKDELQHFINAITVNKTHFFREPAQLNFLTDVIFPELMVLKRRERKLRIWSAACASGEEAYSLAILLREYFGNGWDIRILASDVDTQVLSQARRALYSPFQLRTVSPEQLQHHFLTQDDVPGYHTVKPHLKQMIQFRTINLFAERYPINTQFDLIFCRNVLIYFSKERIQNLLGRLHKILSLNGYLAIGIAESVAMDANLFNKRKLNIFTPVCSPDQAVPDWKPT